MAAEGGVGEGVAYMRFYVLELSDERLRIYRNRTLSVLLYLSTAGAALAGGTVFYLIDAPSVFRYFAYAAWLLGIACLAGLPRYLRRLRAQGGVTVFEATREGIDVVPYQYQLWASSTDKLRCKWREIEGIVLAGTFVQKKSLGSREYARRVMLILLPKGEVGLKKSGRLVWYVGRAPNGKGVLYAPYPEGEESRLIAAIEGLSEGRVRPEAYGTVVFDHGKGAVEYRV